MYDNYDFNHSEVAQQAHEINLRVKREEQQVTAMNLSLHRQTSSGWSAILRQVKSLLGSLLASL